MALDRVRFESIGKAAPGARKVWHALSRFRQVNWWDFPHVLMNK